MIAAVALLFLGMFIHDQVTGVKSPCEQEYGPGFSSYESWSVPHSCRNDNDHSDIRSYPG